MKRETVGLENAQVMAKTIIEMFKEAGNTRSKKAPSTGEDDTTPYEAQIGDRLKTLHIMGLFEEGAAFGQYAPF
jgi:hypothetical protein